MQIIYPTKQNLLRLLDNEKKMSNIKNFHSEDFLIEHLATKVLIHIDRDKQNTSHGQR